jgi:hypothetical protein
MSDCNIKELLQMSDCNIKELLQMSDCNIKELKICVQKSTRIDFVGKKAIGEGMDQEARKELAGKA